MAMITGEEMMFGGVRLNLKVIYLMGKIKIIDDRNLIIRGCRQWRGFWIA